MTRLADTVRNLRLGRRRGIVLWRFDHRGGRLEQTAHGRHHRLAHQDRSTHQDQHDADRNRALERKHRTAARAFLGLAVLRQTRARGGRRRRVAFGLLGEFVIRIGRTRIGATVLHARLGPVEFRRGRRHVGVGLPRRTGGLRGGAPEFVGIGGNVAEAPHARRLRRRVVGAAPRHAHAFAGWRQLRILRRNRGRRRIGAKIARRVLRGPIIARRRRGRTRPRRGRLG